MQLRVERLQPGEVIWVPNYWWHETCGLDEYSAGIGGITYQVRAFCQCTHALRDSCDALCIGSEHA